MLTKLWWRTGWGGFSGLNGITCGHMNADGMMCGHMVVTGMNSCQVPSTYLLDFCTDLMDYALFSHSLSKLL